MDLTQSSATVPLMARSDKEAAAPPALRISVEGLIIMVVLMRGYVKRMARRMAVKQKDGYQAKQKGLNDRRDAVRACRWV